MDGGFFGEPPEAFAGGFNGLADAAAAQAPVPEGPPERLPAMLTYLDVEFKIDLTDGVSQGSVLHFLTKQGKHAKGVAKQMMEERVERNLYDVIDKRVNKDKKVAAVWEGLGFAPISKAGQRVQPGKGSAPQKKEAELVTDLEAMFGKIGRAAGVVAYEWQRARPAAAEGAPPPPPRLAAYPLTVSVARDVLRDANHDGHARGVIPLITPPTIPLEQREIISLLSGLAVSLVPPAPRSPPPPAVPVAPGLEAPAEEVVVPRGAGVCLSLPAQQVDLDLFQSVCEQYFSIYDKGDQPGANALTAAQEALWWVLFTEQQSFGWASMWNKLLDHPQLDAQRMQQEPSGPAAPPRQQGVHAFDSLRRSHARTASNAATIFACAPEEFTKTIVPEEQTTDVEAYFTSVAAALPQVAPRPARRAALQRLSCALC